MDRIAFTLLAAVFVAASCATGPAPESTGSPAAEPEAEEPATVGPDIAGTWTGALDAGAATLRIVFRITADGSGGYTALLDSPDQGAKDVEVSEVKVTGRTVRLEVAVARASYEGTLDEAASTLSGTWRQGGAELPLELRRGEATTPSSEVAPGSPDIADTWNGILDTGFMSIRLVFRIGRDAAGAYTAVLDSPDQGQRDIAVGSIRVSPEHVRLEIPPAQAFFEGTPDPGAMTLEGTWNQGGAQLPLTLRRGEPVVVRRPQTPSPPYPYRVEGVKVRNDADGVILAGTLTLPLGGGPFPGVVLVTGSGPENRDEEIFQHKPFLVLADALSRAGIAVLRCDDRGVGESTGDAGKATSEDFARDALAELRYLEGVAGVDPRRTGFIGHSEGALIATMLAPTNAAVAFIVLLAGPGLPGDQIVQLQTAAILRASGVDELSITASVERTQRIHDLVKSDADLEQVRSGLKTILREAGAQEAQIEASIASLVSPWFRFFLRYDPRRDLVRVKQPVLALIGSKDLQVPAAENVAALRSALAQAENAAATVLTMEGLNHLFQTADTGLPAEYGAIEETIAPTVLRTISDWILALRAGEG